MDLDPDAMGMKVTCGTCHRGHKMPEDFVPPQEHGPGAPPAGVHPRSRCRRRCATAAFELEFELNSEPNGVPGEHEVAGPFFGSVRRPELH
jgi:hypothetical protein